MPQNTQGLLTLLDVDSTLVSPQNKLNEVLVDELKAAGIRDICLFTSMDAKTLLSEDTSGGSSLTRYELVEKLEQEGFKVHAVITPIDPFYGKKLKSLSAVDSKQKASPSVGSAYEELLKRQYDRRHNDPVVKKMKLEDFLNDPEYTRTRLKWEYYVLREILINGLIKCRNRKDYDGLIQSLEKTVEDNISLIEKSSSFAVEVKEEGDDTLTLFKELKKHVSEINKLKVSGEEEKNDQKLNDSHSTVIPSKAMECILEIPWVKESAWIGELLKKGHRSPWDKGSMYACLTNDPFFAKFNGFLFFDDKEECLESVSDLHASFAIKKPLYGVKVHPQFEDRPGYYREKLNESSIVKAIIDEINNEMVDLLKRKNVKNPADLSNEDQARYEALRSLQVKVKEITSQINTYKDSSWKKTYKSQLKAAISKSLSTHKLDKYSLSHQFARAILNLLAGLTVITPFIKYCATGSWFFSREGKTKEAVLRAQELAEKIEEEKVLSPSVKKLKS